ncbi:MAG: hypothetical protein KGL18_06405 [Burkholderiales bacterium]|nr:hypothetical protein [Burkholderiales bacterium]MDE2161065.1 hypothetical protein [Burkholderiales bacterium]MDE2502596.1 hypothetical protein [Burkholderiales bacterium]
MECPQIAAASLARGWCVLPFDVARDQRAAAVQAGLLQPSMLADREFARALDALEHWLLGPLARRN